MKFKNWVTEFSAYTVIVIFWKLSAVILTEIVTIKTIFKSETVSNWKLFPGYNSTSTYFVRLNFKSTIFKAEHMCFLRENSGEQSYNGPAKKATICSCIASIKKRILFFAVAVQITIDPDLSAFDFCQLFQ